MSLEADQFYTWSSARSQDHECDIVATHISQMDLDLLFQDQ